MPLKPSTESTSTKFAAPDTASWRSLSLTQLRDLVRFAARRLEEEQLPQVASSLTFTTVLALVPLLTVALAIFTTFPLFNTFRTALEAYFIKSLMPRGIANTILGYLGQFAAQASRLSAFGSVALIVTSIATLLTIDRAFNHIWRVKTPRPFAQRILIYWAIVTLGPLLIGVSITATSIVFAATNLALMNLPFIGAALITSVSVVLTALAFTLLYIAVPNRFVDWRDAACGGAVAAIAFEIAKRLFAIYVSRFPTYTVVYGAVAALPIFLLWVYLSWLITLVGAVITAALPVIKYERWWHRGAPGSAFLDAIGILRVLHDARANQANAVVDANLIRQQTRLGFDESEALLETMLQAGWVSRIKKEALGRRKWRKRLGDGADGWVLVANPVQLTLAEVYRVFVFDGSSATPVARQVEQAVERGLGQTLAEYFSVAST